MSSPADTSTLERLSAALLRVIEEAARAESALRTAAAASDACVPEHLLATVCDAAEDALVAALAIPLPAPERTRYDPQPGLAELYAAAAQTQTSHPDVSFELAPEPGHMSAGLQLLVHQAVDAGLAARTAHDHATVRLARHGESVEVAVELSAPHAPGETGLAKVSRVAALYGGAISWVDDTRLVLRVPA